MLEWLYHYSVLLINSRFFEIKSVKGMQRFPQVNSLNHPTCHFYDTSLYLVNTIIFVIKQISISIKKSYFIFSSKKK